MRWPNNFKRIFLMLPIRIRMSCTPSSMPVGAYLFNRKRQGTFPLAPLLSYVCLRADSSAMTRPSFATRTNLLLAPSGMRTPVPKSAAGWKNARKACIATCNSASFSLLTVPLRMVVKSHYRLRCSMPRGPAP